jgi:cytidylate kinase
MHKKGIIIAIDGPAGSGKSSTARAVARNLGYLYIDTGAMYRAMALHILESQVDVNDPVALHAVIDQARIQLVPEDKGFRTILNGRDVSLDIRTPRITRESSPLSQIPRVRQKRISLQREMGKTGGVVLEGRDIGTVVFPQAELKIFMTASVEERARRRFAEQRVKGEPQSLEEVMADIRERDRRDQNRAASPLVQAQDAILLDTSDLTLEQQIAEITRQAQEKTTAL